MMNLTRPRFFIPMHGEQQQMMRHAELAVAMGIPQEQVLLLENGDIVELSEEGAEIVGQVAAGACLVDGSGVGFLQERELNERHFLGRDGVLVASLYVNKEGRVVGGPLLETKGFILPADPSAFYEEGKAYLLKALEVQPALSLREVEKIVRSALTQFAQLKTRRRPVVIPLVTQVE
jgi:ribonuclease J